MHEKPVERYGTMYWKYFSYGKQRIYLEWPKINTF